MKDLPAYCHPLQTSARFLQAYARERFYETGTDADRFFLVYAVYIKARSYALINKLAFWASILAGLLVILWPSVAEILKRMGGTGAEAWQPSAVVQTTVTALAALCFAVFSHYKKSQMHAEQVMLELIYSRAGLDELAELVRTELGESIGGSPLRENENPRPSPARTPHRAKMSRLA